MNAYTKPLSDRAIGAYPLSIGTSLAFESIADGPLPPYDPDRQIPQKVDLAKYQMFFVNIASLYRNIMGALKHSEAAVASPYELCEVLNQEIAVIAELIREASSGKCWPQFYSCTYASQYRRQGHNVVQLRKEKTDLQKLAALKMKDTLELFYKHNDKKVFHRYDDTLELRPTSTCLLLSHYPYDLLSYTKAKRLDLLEAHTGKLKPRHLWYTKYHKYPGNDLSTLPFTEKLLKIFGDGPMFVAMDIRYRKMILDVSIQCRWTPLTTEAKIRADLDAQIKERYLYDVYTMI